MSDLAELVELLFAKTMEGKLNWRLDGDRRITLKQGESIVDIEKPTVSDIKITIRNTDGLVIAKSEPLIEFPEFQRLYDIFEKARRDTLGVDRALGALKSSLLQL